MNYKFTVILLLCASIQCYGQQTAQELIDMGYAHYENNEYKKAIDFFDKAEALDSNNAEIYYLRGASKSLLGDNNGALVDLNKAVTFKAEYAEAYFEIGYTYVLLGDTKKSIENFTLAIKYNPSYGEAYLNRATVKCMAGDKAGANKDYAKAKELGMTVPFTCE